MGLQRSPTLYHDFWIVAVRSRVNVAYGTEEGKTMFRISLAALVALHLVATTGLSGQGGRWTIGEQKDDFTNLVDYHFIRTTSNRGGWLELRCDPTAQIFNTTLVVGFGTESIVPYNELEYAFFRYKIDGQVAMEYGRPANLLLREIAEGVYASTTFDDEVSLVDRNELEFEVNYRATLTETFQVAGYERSLNLLRTNCGIGPGGGKEARRTQEEDSGEVAGLRILPSARWRLLVGNRQSPWSDGGPPEVVQ